ncbi:hypothetical protein A0H81_01155 [Grifola frondosa]|uniref:Uncharacterized protein n=1 Tax=Grifola frondosa TaxID=5627 RepID=A0A1C7MUZ2_GRIFR|nr:hypothetical protein A0H81_01155 [Grifola frondosa]
MKLAKERMMALMAGREPPPLPEKVPKLFQIGKAVMISNASVPEGLDRIADAMTKQVQEVGYLKSGEKDLLVRAMWVAEEGSQATLYFCRLITGEMLEEIAGWKQPTEDGEGHLDEPVKTEELIQYVAAMVGPLQVLNPLGICRAFDWRAFNDPDMKQKLL